MRAFKLEEISLVDKPAQQGARAVLMKRSGSLYIPPTEGQKMDAVKKLFGDLDTLNRKMDAILKATARRDLRDNERANPYYVDQDEAEFEKEPEYEEEDYDEEDEYEVGKGRVHRPGRTAAQHEGDWPPGSDEDPAPGRHPQDGTCVDDYVSGDEMTPQRASAVLQPYAQHGEEEYDEEDEEDDAEVDEAVHKFADRLIKRFPRASNAVLAKTLAEAVDSTYVARHENFGREREYAKRAAAKAAPMYKEYTDEELEDRLEKRFGPGAVERARAMYSR
jgi:hypothetical protein